MIFGVRLKTSPRKLSARSRGPFGAAVGAAVTGREGLAVVELTGEVAGSWPPPVFEMLPLFLTVLHFLF